MHIFIDESGLFKPCNERNIWSSIGGVVIPDSSLKGVETALLQLKLMHGIEPHQEFKANRPDCSSSAYMEFLDKLKQVGCTLHIISTRGAQGLEQSLQQHREGTKKAIRNYCSKEPNSADLANETIALIDKLSAQQYNQCILQVNLIFDLLGKVISYYC